MKRIDILVERILKRMINNGTDGDGSVFVDNNGYAYFRDSDVPGFPKTTIKHRRGRPYVSHQYNGHDVVQSNYRTVPTQMMLVKLRKRIKEKILDRGYRMQYNSWGEKVLMKLDPHDCHRAVRSEIRAIYQERNQFKKAV